ncbi:trifunctional serine/threonine-protein kinase/ATP-binding protein/sensor histidine kinase [Stigmatella hybrida]|uniref:trifunctional serine/threonine-protein kinase/ATP-binding protein/sensor histidine kinase n=1 Tax=Stigmatella hybrida TaxID=394097 RepID=UPI001CDAA896|nr:ATP-binding sensor histidine kinase [Stigmatella hybrida]
MASRAGYTFHETIHESSRSMLVRATRLKDECPVILKLPGSDYLDRRRTLEIQREYAIARRVEGDGIIQVFGVEEFTDRAALVLEDFGGRSLHHLLEERGALGVETFLDYAIRITTALGHIHRHGVIHKDIKPQNIIVNPDTGLLKIADFSISVAIAVEAVTPDNPTVLTGTLAYMAPEQTGRMNRGVDYRADFYALGATFFELLTHRHVFESETPLELLHAHVAQMPPSPRELVPAIPEPISAIVVKLLAKDPEARYQTAFGLIADLEECRRRLKEWQLVSSFPLGTSDRTHQFRLPQGFYGRAADVDQLKEAHERAVKGSSELLFITGSPGIGKSSLVNELHRVTAAHQGLFATGKCDPLQRGVPFDAVHQVLNHLVQQMSEEGGPETARVQRRLKDALGVNTSVLVQAVPEVRALLGEQPPPTPLPSSESRNRLNRVLVQALQAFTRPERPLVIFLDDLQWADVATLSWMQSLACEPDSHHLLLLCAYRSTELSPSHPLEQALASLRSAESPFQEIRVSPLGIEEVVRMVREATSAEPLNALELGQLLHARTGGNPFAVREFLRFLHDQRLLRFDASAGRWDWDLAQIDAREIPNDVADLMAAEIRRLPPETTEVLQYAACLGSVFHFKDLTVVRQATAAETARTLWSAIEQGLVLPLSKDYLLLDPQGGLVLPADLELTFRFLHERVRQAAYLQLPQEERAGRHTQIGLRLLEDARAAGAIEARAFNILPHVAYAPEQVSTAALRQELADLHLKAGRQAKASGAYRTACNLFRTGIALLDVTAWRDEYERILPLQLELAESSYLAGDFAAASTGFATLLEQARSVAQKADVLAMRATLASLNSQHTEAIQLGLEGLRLLGVDLPAEPGQAELGQELTAVAERLQGRRAAALLGLPPMSDPNQELALNLLASIAASAYMVHQGLFALLALRIVRISLEHGHSSLSAFGYVIYGVLLSSVIDDPATGSEFGQLAVELSARFRAPMLHARVRYLRAGLIDHWTRNAREGISEFTEAYKGSMESGDWIYAGHCVIVRLWRRLSVGDPLKELQAENGRFIEFLQTKRDPDALEMFLAAHRTVLALTGSEEPLLQSTPRSEGNTARAYQALGELERLYLLSTPQEALAKAEEAEPLLPFVAGLFQVATFAFYHALSAVAVSTGESEERREELLQVAERHRAFLEKCARRNPGSFAPYFLLVSAEKAQAKGHDDEALVTFERAIAAARESGFLGVEALACELTFRFLTLRERRIIASAYLLEALYAYERWGATGKTRLLTQEQSNLLMSQGSTLRYWNPKARGGTTATERGATTHPSTQPSTHPNTHPTSPTSPTNSESLVESLDMASAMKASQAISSEILFPQLVDNLIHVIMESAGAQRGVLALKRGADYFVEASGEVRRRDMAPEPPHLLSQSSALCRPVVEQALRAGTPVLLDDASSTAPYQNDEYVIRNGVRSVLCMPIRHRGQTLGLFYLENNLTPGAFNASRLKVLGMLTAQASISIENAELYRRLEDYSHTLEERVADRTQELHSKNAELHRALETLKTMHAQIVTQEKLASLGSLTAGIAHELKNPLNFVTNFALLSTDRVRELRQEMRPLLQPGLDKPQIDRQQEELNTLLDELELNTQKIREHGQRASGIIDGMLQHARSNRGERRRTNVNQLVEEAVRLVHHGLNAKSSRRNVVIETSYDTQVPEVDLVSDDIRRVVLNLVDNACYAASDKVRPAEPVEEPRVKVSTRWTGSNVEIRVRDNGQGIPQAAREKLFTPFFTTKPTGEGTGLGLSISHDIVVVSLGGKLVVESEEGQYAEFIVVLPSGPRSQSPRA